MIHFRYFQKAGCRHQDGMTIGKSFHLISSFPRRRTRQCREAKSRLAALDLDTRFRGYDGEKNGFSLVELSIVLVILGLLVGGVLTGRDLIRAAELRSVTTEYNGYVTAVNLFKEKYMALPGDMKNATAFWGRADGVAGGGQCAAPATNTGTGTQTCNGDGDGLMAGPTNLYENFRFWQHLANAGLIAGSFTGISSGWTEHAVSGINTPVSKIQNGGWYVKIQNNIAGTPTQWFAGKHAQLYSFGGLSPTSWPANPLFSPDELWNIDTKIDDGKPGMGKLVAFWWPGCTTAATQNDWAAAEYKLMDSTPQCTALFLENKLH